MVYYNRPARMGQKQKDEIRGKEKEKEKEDGCEAAERAVSEKNDRYRRLKRSHYYTSIVAYEMCTTLICLFFFFFIFTFFFSLYI